MLREVWHTSRAMWRRIGKPNPGTDHEHVQLTADPRYLDLVKSPDLRTAASGAAAQRLYNLGDRFHKIAGVFTAVGSVTALITFAASHFNDAITFFAGWLCLAALAASIVMHCIAGAIHRYCRGDLAEHDHEVRQFFQRQTQTSNFPTRQRDILYLRSFSADTQTSKRVGWLTEEEQLVKALAPLGRVVAVGRPGEALPNVGASRLYFTDAEWKERVGELIRTASLVVIRTGSTAGLTWEVQRVVQAVPPSRVLIIAEARRAALAVLKEVALARKRSAPKWIWLRGHRLGSVSGLITFDDSWNPKTLRLKRGAFRVLAPEGPLVAGFTLSLRPLLIKAGRYTPPPLEKPAIYGAALMVLSAPFWIYAAMGVIIVIVQAVTD